MHVVNSSADASWCSESMASAASLFRWQAPEVQSANASAPAAECKTAEPGDKCYKALWGCNRRRYMLMFSSIFRAGVAFATAVDALTGLDSKS